MIEKSVAAATDKLELCQKKAEETELEVKIALEQKYSAKALAESIERERRAAEMRFLATGECLYLLLHIAIWTYLRLSVSLSLYVYQ